MFEPMDYVYHCETCDKEAAVVSKHFTKQVKKHEIPPTFDRAGHPHLHDKITTGTVLLRCADGHESQQNLQNACTCGWNTQERRLQR